MWEVREVREVVGVLVALVMGPPVKSWRRGDRVNLPSEPVDLPASIPAARICVRAGHPAVPWWVRASRPVPGRALRENSTTARRVRFARAESTDVR